VDPSENIGLVLWSLRTHGKQTAESMASHLTQDMTVARTREVLREAEARGLAREIIDGWWEATEAGQRFPDTG